MIQQHHCVDGKRTDSFKENICPTVDVIRQDLFSSLFCMHFSFSISIFFCLLVNISFNQFSEFTSHTLRIFFSSSTLLPLQWTSEYFEVSLSQMTPLCLSECDECVCFSFSCLYSVYFCFLLSPFSSPLLLLSQENLHRQGIRLART